MKPHILALFYGGPDQIIPLQTGLAALLAVALMFWNKLLVMFHRLFGRSKSKPEEISTADAAVPASEQSREQP
jgi:undecaprenyl pyrophosphate phosphatase UppP